MTNFQVYRKTLPFSFIMFLTDVLALLVFLGCCTLGFVIFNKSTDMALLGLLIGFIVGLLLLIPFNIFVTNRIKAAQIAMMTKGVVEDKLPDHTVKEGFVEIKGRFGSITAFYFITNAIKGIFKQLGHAINRLGTAIGGDVGNGVTSAINSAIETLIGYLCDCCLGWILYRKDINAAKAGCEGAVIFFKNGKTLIRNIGRIFGMGFLSLALVGGIFFGGFFLIFRAFPQMFVSLSNEIVEMSSRAGETAPTWISDVTLLTVVACAILAIIMWAIIHSVLIRPFILVGVLRNFMAAGQKNIPSESDFAELDKKSPRFAKLHGSI